MTNTCFDQRSGEASPRHLQGLCDLTTLRDEKRDAGSPTTCRTCKAVQVRALNCSSKENLAGWQELEIVSRGLQCVPIRELSQQTTPSPYQFATQNKAKSQNIYCCSPKMG